MPLTNINDLAELNPQTLVNFVRNLEYPGYELGEFFPDDLVQGNVAQFDKTQLAQECRRSNIGHGTPKPQLVTAKASSVASLPCRRLARRDAHRGAKPEAAAIEL